MGRGNPENLMDLIRLIEKGLEKKASLKMMPLQKGDVLETFADISALKRDFGYKPSVDLEEGMARFLAWFKEYSKH